MPRFHLFFTYAAVLHLVWAGLLVLSPHSANATVTSFFLDAFHIRLLVALLLCAASVLALWTVYKVPLYSWCTIFALTPQAVFMLLAATGAVQAIMSGQYADGVQRSFYFIAADQSPAVIAALCHQWALAATHGNIIRRLLWKE